MGGCRVRREVKKRVMTDERDRIGFGCTSFLLDVNYGERRLDDGAEKIEDRRLSQLDHTLSET